MGVGLIIVWKMKMNITAFLVLNLVVHNGTTMLYREEASPNLMHFTFLYSREYGRRFIYRVSQEECARLRSNYTDITQNTYIQSSMFTEILAREV